MTLMAEHWENERYSATMRAIFGAGMVIVLFSPVIIAVLWGAWLIGLGYVSVGAVTAVALYAQQLRGPIDELSWWIDEMQFAAVALARILAWPRFRRIALRGGSSDRRRDRRSRSLLLLP